MNVLATFISTQLIKAIESEFINHSPEIQAAIIHQIQNFLIEGTIWVENKLAISKKSTGE
jgi:hypothetical protein